MGILRGHPPASLGFCFFCGTWGSLCVRSATSTDPGGWDICASFKPHSTAGKLRLGEGQKLVRPVVGTVLGVCPGLSDPRYLVNSMGRFLASVPAQGHLHSDGFLGARGSSGLRLLQNHSYWYNWPYGSFPSALFSINNMFIVGESEKIKIYRMIRKIICDRTSSDNHNSPLIF